MGKKKIITAEATAQQAIKESEAVDNAATKIGVQPLSSGSRKIEKGRVYIKASYNNTIVTVTDDKGEVLAWASAGSLGFSGPKKATPFAASKVIAILTEKLRKSGPLDISVLVNGMGGGRDSAIRSLINQGFNVLSITDVTPIPHNGPRPPKLRRV
jgi:small subunit ribosomal protein S11